jgi:hypothetical protein
LFKKPLYLGEETVSIFCYLFVDYFLNNFSFSFNQQ